MTFNLAAIEETSTIIFDTESRQRYTDIIDCDVSGTKTSEDHETECTPMISCLSFTDETSVDTYHRNLPLIGFIVIYKFLLQNTISACNSLTSFAAWQNQAVLLICIRPPY